MKYYKLLESKRVLAISVDILMSPRWLQISKEEYDLRILELPKVAKEITLDRI
jgi:hypothetical protein